MLHLKVSYFPVTLLKAQGPKSFFFSFIFVLFKQNKNNKKKTFLAPMFKSTKSGDYLLSLPKFVCVMMENKAVSCSCSITVWSRTVINNHRSINHILFIGLWNTCLIEIQIQSSSCDKVYIMSKTNNPGVYSITFWSLSLRLKLTS